MVIPRSWLAAASGLVGFAITLFIACSGDDAEAMRMVNTAVWLAADGGSSSGSSSSSSSGGGGPTCLDSGVTPGGVACCAGVDGVTWYGTTCCSPPINGGSWQWCTDWQAQNEAGAGIPSTWQVNTELMMNPLAAGSGNLGCATASAVQLTSEGLVMTATPYDGGGCFSYYDAGTPATPNGYGADMTRVNGDLAPFTLTFDTSIPDGTGSCSISGNCVDPTIWELQTYSPGTGVMDGGGLAAMPSGCTSGGGVCHDIWQLNWPGSPFYGVGDPYFNPPPYYPEIDNVEHYAGVFNHSLFINAAATQNNLPYTHYGTFQKLSETVTPGTSLHLFGAGLNDTISNGQLPGAAIHWYMIDEIRTIHNYAATLQLKIAAQGNCTPGDGGPCF